MKSLLAIIILTVIFLASPICAFADSNRKTQQSSQLNSKKLKQLQRQSLGGVSDGGSSGVYVGNRLVLLDIYAIDTRLHEQKNGSPLVVANKAQVIVKDQPAFLEAIQLLESSALPKPVQELIRQALTNMEFRVINQEMPVKRASVPSWLAERSTAARFKTIAMYSEDYGGAAISERYWNQLGNLSQAGVLIHEALRHIQFVDEESKSENHLSDEVLQDLTAQIILKVQATDKAAAMGWLIEEAILADVKLNQVKVTAICKQIAEQFPGITSLVKPFCTKPLPQDELGHLNALSAFAITMTNLISEYLPTPQGKVFLQTREQTSVVYLNYLLASVRKSNFGFMRLKYRLNSISFLD